MRNKLKGSEPSMDQKNIPRKESASFFRRSVTCVTRFLSRPFRSRSATRAPLQCFPSSPATSGKLRPDTVQSLNEAIRQYYLDLERAAITCVLDAIIRGTPSSSTSPEVFVIKGWPDATVRRGAQFPEKSSDPQTKTATVIDARSRFIGGNNAQS